MKRHRRRLQREPTISLINIIFLILIFFMLSGTLTPPASPRVELVRTSGLDCCAGTGVLEVTAEGMLLAQGRAVADARGYLETLAADEPVRVVPDRRLPAQDLLRLIADLRAAGAERVVVVTENEAP